MDDVMREAIRFLSSSGVPEAAAVGSAFEKMAAALDARKAQSITGAVEAMMVKMSGGDTLGEWARVMQRQQDLASDEVFALGQIVLAINNLKRAMERP